MDRSAIAQIKASMNYTEEPVVACNNCRFCESKAEGLECHLAPAFAIPVAGNGRCDHFKKPPIPRRRREESNPPEAQSSESSSYPETDASESQTEDREEESMP